MLVHREIDEAKRKDSWISKLQDVAKFTVETTSADHFSSSKGAVHSEQMKKRALEQILPSIFDVGQAYEDHIMQYNLIEGSGNVDPGRGKHHTWKPIPKPARQTPPKRPRKTMGSSLKTVSESIYDASGDETEPDDTMVRLAGLPQAVPQPRSFTTHIAEAEDNHSQLRKADTPISTTSPCTPTASQDDYRMHRTASTPNSSFNTSLHGLHLDEDDMDMKTCTRTMSHHGNVPSHYSMVSYNQPMQYSSSQSSFGSQVFQPTNDYPNSVPAQFTQATRPGFANPFMFNAPPPPMEYIQYANPMPASNGYTYEQGIFPGTPMSFPSTPMSMPMTPTDMNNSYHGLPNDYTVDPQGYHQF